jgi:hypothetical protein
MITSDGSTASYYELPPDCKTWRDVLSKVCKNQQIDNILNLVYKYQGIPVYGLPPGATQLQDLISYKNMNAQMGEIFRSAYRFGQASHSDSVRDLKKILFYVKAERERATKYASLSTYRKVILDHIEHNATQLLTEEVTKHD